MAESQQFFPEPNPDVLAVHDLESIRLTAEEAARQSEAFIRDVAPHLGRMFGIPNLNIRIGKGWATSLETGDVTADPSFFTERGYTADMSVYATLHEIVAHLREVQTEPALTARVMRFAGRGRAEGIFHNVLADIAGNNRIHAALPRMAKVAHELYDTKLFPTIEEETGEPVDYSATRKYPRHLQFLYKIIREEMIPDSETTVQPEVEEAIERLRDYHGQGDVIKYSTETPKRKGAQLSATDRFNTWIAVIYPEYQKLVELDKADPEAGADAKSESGDQQQGGGEQSGGGQFDKAYDDYQERHHPEPLDHAEQQKVSEHARQNAHKKRKRIDPEQERDKQLRKETGFGIKAHQEYRTEVEKNSEAIARMRDVYRQVISERIALRRGLSRTAYTEGILLDPNRLPQTIVDIKTGVSEPEAFQRYERRKGETKAEGKTDYLFVFDCSGSMFEGEVGARSADAAAQSTVLLLEGLAAMQRDIQAAEEEYDMDLELDVRTAVYTFGTDAKCVKPLSNTLSDKDRLQALHEVRTQQGGTSDFLALEAIADIPLESDRKRVVIIATDGGSDDDERSLQAQARLRQQGVSMFCISINSDEAVELYRPDATRVDDAKDLPDAFEAFVESTLL